MGIKEAGAALTKDKGAFPLRALLQALLLCLQRSLISFLLQPNAFLAEAALTEYGDHQILLKRIGNGVTHNWDPHNSHDSLRTSYGQKQPFGIRQGIGGGSGMLIVFLDPFGHADLLGTEPG